MPGRNEERWKKLCEQASEEKDPNRLMELVEEINSLLGGDSVAGVPKDVPSTPKVVDAA